MIGLVLSCVPIAIDRPLWTLFKVGLVVAVCALARTFLIFATRWELPEQGFESGIWFQTVTLLLLAHIAPGAGAAMRLGGLILGFRRMGRIGRIALYHPARTRPELTCPFQASPFQASDESK